MRSFRDLSIRNKLMLLMMLTSAGALLLASAGFFTFYVIGFRRSAVQNAETLATIIGAESTAALTFRDQKAAGDILQALGAEKDVACAELYDAKGTILAAFSRSEQEELAEAHGLHRPGHFFSANYLDVFQAIAFEGATIGTVHVRMDLRSLSTRLWQYGAIGGAILVVALLSALLLATRLQRVLSRPILKLADTAQAVSQRGDYSLRAEKEAHDEVGTLVDGFNAMLARIEEQNSRLRTYNEELEKRVEERTSSLQQEVAERQRAETELQKLAERLVRSNRELQDFAYAASHDLQEPLRKIEAFGDRLKSRSGGQLDAQSLDYMERMRNAAVRMRALINGLLDYSRVSSKGQEHSIVNLGRVIRAVLGDLEVRLEDVRGRVEMGEMPTIRADPLQMRLLFQNLIGNALKYHGEAPPVVQIACEILGEVPADSLEDAPPAGQLCRITVKDNGIGFEPKYSERIFGVFQRLHGRGQYEGTGIGLAICRKIAERHGGRITAESTPGNGATFVIHLPMGEVTAAERD